MSDDRVRENYPDIEDDLHDNEGDGVDAAVPDEVLTKAIEEAS